MLVDGNEITHCKREGMIDMIITNCKQQSRKWVLILNHLFLRDQERRHDL